MFLFVFFGSKASAQSPSQLVKEGMEHFRRGDLEKSLTAFEAAVAGNPAISPKLWQLGISRYYAGQFEKSQKQFETHQTVNPHDVENAAWHFLCMAKRKGLAEARKSLLPIETNQDKREPMTEIYEFYAGRGSAEAVLQAAGSSHQPAAKMYAHLYLGLYHEVVDNINLAKKHLRLAADAKLEDHYMHDVAKVHLRLRGWQPLD